MVCSRCRTKCEKAMLLGAMVPQSNLYENAPPESFTTVTTYRVCFGCYEAFQIWLQGK